MLWNLRTSPLSPALNLIELLTFSAIRTLSSKAIKSTKEGIGYPMTVNSIKKPQLQKYQNGQMSMPPSGTWPSQVMEQHLHLDLTLLVVITPTYSSHHPPLKSYTLHPDAHILYVVMSIVAIDVCITLPSQTSITKQFIVLIKLGRHSRNLRYVLVEPFCAWYS